MKKISLSFFYGLFFITANSQKQVTHLSQTWLGYNSQVRWNKHWGASLDLQIRTRTSFVDGFSQGNARAGLVYYTNSNVRLATGYYFANSYLGQGQWAKEHSPWQQVAWQTKSKRFGINQSLRFEERFRRNTINNKLAEGYNFNYRSRYNILMSYDLNKKAQAKGGFDAVAYHEIYFNFGKKINYNTFDQVRFFGGFNYHVSSNSTLQLGYLQGFQQLTAGNKYRMLHAARLFYLYNLDLHKKYLKTKLPTNV